MANDDQAQADLPTETPVVDPLDATNSQDGTKQAFDEYTQAVQAALSEEPQSEPDQESEQGDESAEDAPDQAEEDDSSEEAEEEQAEEEEPEPVAKAKDRFRFQDPLDQKIAAVAKAMGVNLIEAAKIVEGQTSTKHQAEEQSQQAVESVATVQARLEELEDMEAQASSNLEFETANEHRREANKLRNKLVDLKIAEVQEKSRTEAEAERKFYEEYRKNEEEAIRFYPDAAKPDSALSKKIAQLDAEMAELDDPLYYSEKKPIALAKKAAVALGIPMANPNRPAAKKAAPNRPIQPASGNARTTTTDPAKRTSEVIDGLKTVEDYESLVASLGR
jgi:hypothetical protein